MSQLTCTNCGQPMSASSRFCVNCGHETELPPPEEGKVPWRALEALGIYATSLLLTVVATLVLAVAITERDLLTVIGIGVNELMTLGVVLFWVRTRYGAGPADLALTGLTRSNVGAGVTLGIGGILLATGVSIVVSVIVRAVTGRPVEGPEQIRLDTDPSALVLLLIAMSVVVLAPIAEEVFFRGFLFRALRNWLSPANAIGLSAAIFAVSHILPLVIAPIFALGILLAASVERRGSIVPAIVAHMTFNAFGFTFQFIVNR